MNIETDKVYSENILAESVFPKSKKCHTYYAALHESFINMLIAQKLIYYPPCDDMLKA